MILIKNAKRKEINKNVMYNIKLTNFLFVYF